MNRFIKIYYQLTKYVPRALPRTEEEFKEFKHILTHAYGLEDHPKYLYTLASQLVAGGPTSLFRSYGKMINAVKKLDVAALSALQRDVASEELRARLEAKTKEMQDALKKEEASQGEDRIEPKWGDVPGQPHPDVPSGPHNLQ